MAVNLEDLGWYVIFDYIRSVLLAQNISCTSLPSVFFRQTPSYPKALTRSLRMIFLG